ncbi:MAG: hypothetical protein IJ150_11110 [Bacteroidales bacterium]|nr:hypothetical protein [Bacteroidales bacterium]
MKKLNKKIVAIAMLVATVVNPLNSFSNVKIDTLKSANTSETTISPDSEELLEETTLELEDWMFERIETTKEESLEIEDWMTEKIELINEEKLNIEDWMSEKLEENFEEKLELESWMSETIDTGINEPTLKIESWMSNRNYFQE